MRKNLRDIQRSQAAYTHSLVGQAVPVRGVLQSLHAVLEPLPPQADARWLSHANQVQQVRTKFQHRDVIIEAQTILWLNRIWWQSTSSATAAIATGSVGNDDPSQSLLDATQPSVILPARVLTVPRSAGNLSAGLSTSTALSFAVPQAQLRDAVNGSRWQKDTNEAGHES